MNYTSHEDRTRNTEALNFYHLNFYRLIFWTLYQLLLTLGEMNIMIDEIAKKNLTTLDITQLTNSASEFSYFPNKN